MSLIDALIKSGLVRPHQRNQLKSVINKWLQEQIASGAVKQLNLNTFVIKIVDRIIK